MLPLTTKPRGRSRKLTEKQSKQQTAADRKRAYDNARLRAQSVVGREIGPDPAIVDPARRASTREDLRRFYLTYFPAVFNLTFSPDHLRMIAKLERAMLRGGLFAFAMPRGGGKSVMTIVAAMFALLHGHIQFACLVGATEAHAEQLLAAIKSALLTNDLLLADFPEVCHPIRQIENDGRRAGGQLRNGIKTNIVWGANKLVLPTTPESPSSAAIVSVCGLTGRIRGQNHTMPDGRIIRPTLCIVDDPQTKTSAYSDSQCAKRVGILSGDVLMLAGPGVKISAVMPTTIIRPGDMSDQILDRKRHPEWQGERARMLNTFPANTKLWDEYAAIRSDSMGRDGDGAEATEFYRANRDAMDAGADAAWPARFNTDEISAVQSAMNLYIRDPEAFMAECQNDPKPPAAEAVNLKPADIAAKTNGHVRGTIPTECQKLTGFVDVMDDLLYWAVCAWNPDTFGGFVIDYGTWPDQGRAYFTLRQANPTMASRFPGLTKEGTIAAGLQALTTELLGRLWPRDDGDVMTIDKLLVDRGYVPDTVAKVIRAAGRGQVIMPAKGVGIGAAAKPMTEYRAKPGEQIGMNWTIPQVNSAGELRHVRHDTNFWKSFVHNRLALSVADKGSLSLFGDKPHTHRLFADHLTAEFRTPTEGQGRKLDEWRPRPTHPDNHWFDTLVGCAVAASVAGCGKSLMAPKARARRPSYRETVEIGD